MEMGGVIAAEWSENIEGALEGEVITVTIAKLDDNTRKIMVEGGAF